VNQPDRAATIADRLQQTRDEIAMYRAGIAARAVLQDAEAVDDDVDAMGLDQPRQIRRIHRHDRHFQIECGGLLRRRKMPRDADHVKTFGAEVVGDEPSDQAGGAEQQDLARRSFCIHGGYLKRLRDHQPQDQHDRTEAGNPE
jgi:hypothetical protein